MDTLIIGGGAAGMAAALAAAERGDRVTVLERGRKPLKKLAISGNGRGNLMNLGPLRYYGDEAFARAVLTMAPPDQIQQFWADLGVSLVQDDENRVYPSAYLASVAVDALNSGVAERGVQVIPNTRATAIHPRENGFLVEAVEALYGEEMVKANGKLKKAAPLGERPASYSAGRVIVTVGGAAAPAQGTDGGAYALLTALGHHLVPIRPALCALVTETAPLRGLEGQRVRAKLRLFAPGGALLEESRGEALFAKDGVSGIAAMELGRFAEKGCRLEMDLREAVLGDPAGDGFHILQARQNRLSRRPLSRFLDGAATAALADALYRAAGLDDRSRPVSTLTDTELRSLAGQIAAFSLPVLGVRGFEAAQVTAGGIDTSEFDPRTLESKKVPGLFAAGEILNVDGACGGYNLMFAFASGLLTGRWHGYARGFHPLDP